MASNRMLQTPAFVSGVTRPSASHSTLSARRGLPRTPHALPMSHIS